MTKKSQPNFEEFFGNYFKNPIIEDSYNTYIKNLQDVQKSYAKTIFGQHAADAVESNYTAVQANLEAGKKILESVMKSSYNKD